MLQKQSVKDDLCHASVSLGTRVKVNHIRHAIQLTGERVT